VIADKILLVDDDADDQLFFCDAVKDINPDLRCELANHGQEALTILSFLPHPRMIFLDLNMPVMNGFDCLSEIRKNEHLNNIPVIIFTTTSEHATIKRAYELGANAFFKKPNDFKTIVQKLRHLLETDFDITPKSTVFSLAEFSV
jgi:CheY-like chemotaxis protein